MTSVKCWWEFEGMEMDQRPFFMEADATRWGGSRNIEGLRFLLFLNALKIADHNVRDSETPLNQTQWPWWLPAQQTAWAPCSHELLLTLSPVGPCWVAQMDTHMLWVCFIAEEAWLGRSQSFKGSLSANLSNFALYFPEQQINLFSTLQGGTPSVFQGCLLYRCSRKDTLEQRLSLPLFPWHAETW